MSFRFAEVNGGYQQVDFVLVYESKSFSGLDTKRPFPHYAALYRRVGPARAQQILGEPADVARAVRAIADGLLDYSAGQVLNVDGGFHLRTL